MKRSTTVSSASAAIAAVALALSGCGGSTSANSPSASAATEAPKHFAVVSAGSLEAMKAIPVPSDAVLDLTGRISRTNSGDGLTIDLATLETLPIVSGSVFEPFVKKATTFSGVLLSDLLTAAGADGKASSVFITALDDYTWLLPIEVARSGEVLLATRENGKAIPIEKGGPIRIVFSDDSMSGKDSDSWVWSVRGMQVR
ncbi:MAG: molybdopterin-dependent oxidoreductase [Actinomycetota bacterium]